MVGLIGCALHLCIGVVGCAQAGAAARQAREADAKAVWGGVAASSDLGKRSSSS